MAAKRNRTAIYGNDLYREIASPDERQPLQVTYWDLWIVLALIRQFDGNWDSMIDHLHVKRQELSYRDRGRRTLEPRPRIAADAQPGWMGA